MVSEATFNRFPWKCQGVSWCVGDGVGAKMSANMDCSEELRTSVFWHHKYH